MSIKLDQFEIECSVFVLRKCYKTVNDLLLRRKKLQPYPFHTVALSYCTQQKLVNKIDEQLKFYETKLL